MRGSRARGLALVRELRCSGVADLGKLEGITLIYLFQIDLPQQFDTLGVVQGRLSPSSVGKSEKAEAKPEGIRPAT